METQLTDLTDDLLRRILGTSPRSSRHVPQASRHRPALIGAASSVYTDLCLRASWPCQTLFTPAAEHRCSCAPIGECLTPQLLFDAHGPCG
jgi:hypothetical protein